MSERPRQQQPLSLDHARRDVARFMSDPAFYELQVNENYETGNFLAVVNAVVRGCDATACELCARLRSNEVDTTIASACPSAAGPYLNLAARILGVSRPLAGKGRAPSSSESRDVLAGACASWHESLSSARSDRSAPASVSRGKIWDMRPTTRVDGEPTRGERTILGF